MFEFLLKHAGVSSCFCNNDARETFCKHRENRTITWLAIILIAKRTRIITFNAQRGSVVIVSMFITFWKVSTSLNRCAIHLLLYQLRNFEKDFFLYAKNRAFLIHSKSFRNYWVELKKMTWSFLELKYGVTHVVVFVWRLTDK